MSVEHAILKPRAFLLDQGHLEGQWRTRTGHESTVRKMHFDDLRSQHLCPLPALGRCLVWYPEDALWKNKQVKGGQKDGIDSSLRKGNSPHQDFEMSNLPWPLALEDGGRFCQLPLCCPRAASRGPRGSAASCLDKSAAWRISRGSAHALALGEAQQKEGPEGEGPRQPFGSPPSKGFKPLHLPKVCLHILSVRWEETSRCVSPHPRGFVTAAWGARDGNSEGAEQQRPDEGHTVTEGHVMH